MPRARKMQSKSVEGPSSSSGKLPQKVKLVSSTLAFHGPVFDVYTDMVQEPGGKPSRKDVIRHHGSAVILPVHYPSPQKHKGAKAKVDPLILLERQYRHAAGQYLWELPAGRLEHGETPLAGAKRELAEETGYRARRWSKLVRFYASPGFLGEWMQVFLAEDLRAGEDSPDEDEIIYHQLFPFSEVLAMVLSGKILDVKTIVSILLFARRSVV